ncbi:MAG: 4Fe-4S binding protein [Desulfobacteraceae bacterium]|nr:4Fe-4S binding protein [Desulfobacteraceae bacterium]
MQWTVEAEAAIKKVPFFVRKRVRARVENETRQEGKDTVTLAEVTATQQRYLTGMAAEVKGYQLDACFGPAGCPNQIQPSTGLPEKIENLLRAADLVGFLKSKGIQDLKFHHEFRVTLADCPNACSQPQIKDIGIIGAARPQVGEEACSGCNTCVETCREGAISLDDQPRPRIEQERCVACGQCIPVCPTGTIVAGPKGYRVQLGGKLGRHPQLARELPGIYTEEVVVEIVAACIELYKQKSRRGERFGELLQAEDFERLARQFASRRL